MIENRMFLEDRVTKQVIGTYTISSTFHGTVHHSINIGFPTDELQRSEDVCNGVLRYLESHGVGYQAEQR